jgi:hypothetical protein
MEDLETMRKRISAVLAASLFGLGIGVSQAQTPAPTTTPSPTSQTSPMGQTSMQQQNQQELNKHLALIDFHVMDAVSGIKALDFLGDQQLKQADKAIVDEVRMDVSSAIDRSLTHIAHVRTLKGKITAGMNQLPSDLPSDVPITHDDVNPVSGQDESIPGAPQTGMGQDMSGQSGQSDQLGQDQSLGLDRQNVAGSDPLFTRLDEVERNLQSAKTALRDLANVKPDQISTRLDTITTSIQSADQALNDVAKQANFTRLGQMNLGSKVPVRGFDPLHPFPGMNDVQPVPGTDQDIDIQNDTDQNLDEPTAPAPSPGTY